MKTFVISEPLANAILQYLGRQPYAEVAGMVAALMQLKEVVPSSVSGSPLKVVPGSPE